MLLAKSGQKNTEANQYPYQRDQRDPFAGIGKPEPLKYDFQRSMVKTVDAENRLIYMLDESGVAFLSFKDHY